MATESDVKAQPVRVMDVFILGPAMVLSSACITNPLLRAVILIGGMGTIAYNAVNYAKVRRRIRSQQP